MGAAFQSRMTAVALAASALMAAPAVVQAQDGQQVSPAPKENRPERPSMVITAPRWAASPRVELPERAISAGVMEGRVQLSCGVLPTSFLGDCVVITETPEGYGFGEAAVRGAQTARVSAPGRLDPEARAVFTIQFRGPPPPDELIENPQWRTAPRASFPRGARRAGITSATVRLQCLSSWTARMRNCTVLEESHPGQRFGAAALDAARRAEMAPHHLANLGPMTRIVFTVAFQDESAR